MSSPLCSKLSPLLSHHSVFLIPQLFTEEILEGNSREISTPYSPWFHCVASDLKWSHHSVCECVYLSLRVCVCVCLSFSISLSVSLSLSVCVCVCVCLHSLTGKNVPVCSCVNTHLSNVHRFNHMCTCLFYSSGCWPSADNTSHGVDTPELAHM